MPNQNGVLVNDALKLSLYVFQSGGHTHEILGGQTTEPVAREGKDVMEGLAWHKRGYKSMLFGIRVSWHHEHKSIKSIQTNSTSYPLAITHMKLALTDFY